MSQTFASLELCTPLLQAVERLGYTAPTAVQSQVVPAAMRGGDLLVSSQTGSGKTAAFLLPVLNGLMAEALAGRILPGRASPLAVVLCPTRELAQQVSADAIELVRGGRGVRIATIMGGMPYGKQIAALKGAALVVATPGRLLDLCNTRAIRLDQVRCLVVDEADRMLDLGFADDLQAIHERCAQRSQTLMFSATFAGRVMTLASGMTRDAVRIELNTAQDRHDNITQTLHWADSPEHKRRLLDHWLSDVTLDQAVVFASTQVESEQIADELRARGFQASALHGAMPQALRNRRLDGLRRGQTKILVATDVAARGIDVPTISHVINFGLPMKAEDYVHRIGRTGRAGRSGVAVTLAEHRERVKVRAIERFTQQPLDASVIAGLEPQRSERPRGPSDNRRPGGPRAGHRPGAPRGAGAPRGPGGPGRGGAPRSHAPGGSRDGVARAPSRRSQEH
ncbi:MAG: DEAD/DEAH box helicase [Pseudomonadota bacterium]|nr:DEAD/DEAH box helicase [Pseudomonadota bacterium]